MVWKRAGISVYIHPEVNSRRIHVELKEVTLGEALTAIAVESKTVWRALTSSAISVQRTRRSARRESHFPLFDWCRFLLLGIRHSFSN
jgi:hypothetical protein